jgi:type 1 glutamine amidotransferase
MKNSKIILALFVAVFMVMNISAKKQNTDDLPSLKGKKILIVYGGWKGHKPKAFVDMIVPWLEAEGAVLTISDSLGVYTRADIMDETDLIIQSVTMLKITKAEANGLLNAVKNGAGIAGCHGGTGDSFHDNVAYQYMIGGQWVAHPGGFYDYTVNITDSKDPITKGLSDFSVHSEQYYMHVDPNIKVLATTTFSGDADYWIDGAVIPVAWEKYYAKGRVFYLSIGHSPSEFEVPEAWELLTRGIRWASDSKYQAESHLVHPVYPSDAK